MANEVFVNDLEVACKAADGVSSCAFPDPCFTPSGPIPFPNTAYAKDTANGSKTVFISGKEVVLKDYSYFKTSTGNEAAKGRKGLATGDNKGKAYFRSWSMNVKIEGYNVCRHTDSMTHNHGSQSGNTGVWKYWDTGFFRAPCQDEFQKVERACGGQKAEEEKDFLGKGTHKVWKNNKKYEAGGWKRKHCKFLDLKPNQGLKELEKPEDFLKDLKNNISNVDIMGNLASEVGNKVIDISTKKLLKLGIKVVGSKFIPIVGWVYSIFTGAEDFSQIGYLKEQYIGASNEVNRIATDIQNIKNELEKTINAVSSGNKEVAANKIADWQKDAAILDDCIRARKCMLVPFSDAQSSKYKVKRDDRGCCKGQTGHHLIPKSFVRNSGCKDDKGNSYEQSEAPTVCAEGTTHGRGGSHQSIHTMTTKMVVPREDWGTRKATSRSYEGVRDDVIKAHARIFPFSLCSRACLKAQLDKYHQKCKNLTVKEIGKNAAKDIGDNPLS